MKKILLTLGAIIIILIGVIWITRSTSPQSIVIHNNEPTSTLNTTTDSASSTDIDNYRKCPYGTQDIHTTTRFDYKNTALGFGLDIPAGWFLDSATNTDPHFYDCAKNAAFEIQGAATHGTLSAEQYFSQYYKEYEAMLARGEKVSKNLIPGASVIKYVSEGEGDGWPEWSLILFEKEKKIFVFGSYNPIDADPLISTFHLSK